MASALPFDNPIAYAHLQLRGGWKNIALTTGAYAAAVVLLILLSLRLNPKNPAVVYSAWTGILLGIQAALLLLFGANTVNTAVRNDVNGGMIESHRLMPLSSMVAVGGYLIGPPVQAIGMAFATFVIGSLTTGASGAGFSRWAIPNGVLCAFALFLWIVSVFTNLAAKNGFRWVMAMLTLGAVTQGAMFYLLPGMLVILSPVMRATVFAVRTGGASLDLGYFMSFAAQAIIGAILYLAAARKYRSAEAPALSPLLGLMLLAAWVGISVMGMAYWDEFRPMRWMFPSTELSVQFIGSLLVSMLLAIAPLSSSARLQAEYDRRRRINDLSLPPKTIPPLLTAVLASVLVLLVTAAIHPEDGPQTARMRTAVMVLSSLVAVTYVLRIMARRRAKALFMLIVFLVLAWAGPLLLDFVRYGLGDGEEDVEVIGPVSSASPIGFLIRTWYGDELRTTPGVWAMAALAVVLGVVFHSRKPKKRRKTTETGPPPAVTPGTEA